VLVTDTGYEVLTGLRGLRPRPARASAAEAHDRFGALDRSAAGRLQQARDALREAYFKGASPPGCCASTRA
jgi:hypothetical protein